MRRSAFMPAMTFMGLAAPAEYTRIEETLVPEALTLISNWIISHTKD